MTNRGVALALFVLTGVWLGGVITFVARGITGGQLQGAGPVLVSLIFAGLMPALFFGTVAAIFWRQGNLEHNSRATRSEPPETPNE